MEKLTDLQKQNILKYSKTNESIEKVNLDHYSQPKFGPWCPYWTVYSRAKSHLKENSRMLIIGSGTGLDAILYGHLGYQVDAVDISETSTEIAKKRCLKENFGNRINFHVSPAESMRFDDNTFDIAVGINVLHHLNIANCIQELHRVLKPGGRAIFKEPRLTPWRDYLLNIPPLCWVKPKGWEERGGILVPGEKNLDSRDFMTIRTLFKNLKITRFHVLMHLHKIFGTRVFWEKFDFYAFKIIPGLRYLGDDLVLDMNKPEF